MLRRADFRNQFRVLLIKANFLRAKFFKTIDLQIYTGHFEINRPVITNYGQEIFTATIKLFSPFLQDLATNTDIATSEAGN